jgi:two-component system chemotaxis sensor kinase CheA
VFEVPEITDLSSDECFLHWRFFLNTSHGKSAIKEVFEWVEDDADITIELCGGLFTDDIPAPAPATNIIDSNAVGNDAAPTLEPLTPEPITEPAKQAKPIKPTSASANKKSTTPESTSIRVGIDKVDSLINMVGELVITQAMLNQLSEQDITPATITALQEGLAQLVFDVFL